MLSNASISLTIALSHNLMMLQVSKLASVLVRPRKISTRAIPKSNLTLIVHTNRESQRIPSVLRDLHLGRIRWKVVKAKTTII